ncbi:MAG: hypothetical protein H6980_09480 [Gammaproteobacteria bacterium]|nr:hypothetical protein [Gammaproteobacteria bacterium]
MNVSRLSSLTLMAIAALVMLGSLGGCGYHLRGAIDLPASLQRVYLESGTANAAFAAKLRNTLTGAGAELVDAPAANAATLRLLSVDEQRATAGRDANRSAAQYRLGLNVRFSALSGQSSDARVLSASASQILNYDPAQPLEMERQERVLFEQMYNGVIQQMIRQLSVAN